MDTGTLYSSEKGTKKKTLHLSGFFLIYMGPHAAPCTSHHSIPGFEKIESTSWP